MAALLVRIRAFALVVTLLALVSACTPPPPPRVPQGAAPATATFRTTVFPGETWDRIASPESVGFSRAKLDAAAAHARQLATTSFVAVVNGRILVDYGDTTHLSYIVSTRKRPRDAVRQLRQDRHDPFGQDLEGTGHHGHRRALRAGGRGHGRQSARRVVRRLSSGLVQRRRSGKRAAPQLARRHGTYYLYSNWDFNVAGTIFEKETGRDIYDALEIDLARPIGMQDFQRDLQKKEGDLTKSMHAAYPMWFSTRDMARIGYLMLREGNWAGRQVVPSDWARRIVKLNTPITEMNPPHYRSERLGYGYLWWIFDGPQATRPVRGRVHRRGRRRPVHHGAAEARSRRRAQDRFQGRQADRLARAVPRPARRYRGGVLRNILLVAKKETAGVRRLRPPETRRRFVRTGPRTSSGTREPAAGCPSAGSSSSSSGTRCCSCRCV